MMTTTVQELKDQIELDVLRRINRLEHDVRDLRNKVEYDVLSKSERARESSVDGCNVLISQALIAELKIQNSLLQSQVDELRALVLICQERTEATKSNESDDKAYW